MTPGYHYAHRKVTRRVKVKKATRPKSPNQLRALESKRIAQNMTQYAVVEAVTDRLPHLLDCAYERGAWVWLVVLPMRLTDEDRFILREIGFRHESRRDIQSAGEVWQHKCGWHRRFDPKGNPFNRYGGDRLDTQFSFGANTVAKTSNLANFCLALILGLSVASGAYAGDDGGTSAGDMAAQYAAHACGVTWPDVTGWTDAQCWVRARNAALKVYETSTCATDTECAKVDKMAQKQAVKAARGTK
jgi:hypothetical protein